MDPLLILKANFAANLEKQGSSLMELEDALSHCDTQAGAVKSASLLKKAFLDKFNPLDTVKPVGGTAAASVLLPGYLLSSGLEWGDKRAKEKNKKLQVYKDKISLLDKLTKKVQQEHEHQHE